MLNQSYNIRIIPTSINSAIIFEKFFNRFIDILLSIIHIPTVSCTARLSITLALSSHRARRV